MTRKRSPTNNSKTLNISQILDLKPQITLDALSQCANCNSCRDYCPIYLQTGNESDFAGGRSRLILTYFKEKFELDEQFYQNMFFCSMCGQCEEKCPLGLNIVLFLEKIRTCVNQRNHFNHLKHNLLSDRVNAQFNPYNELASQRGDWKKPIQSQIQGSLRKEGKIAYFVGCTAAYRDQESARNTALILKALLPEGFVILDAEEYCCGSPLFRTGVSVPREFIHHNIEKLRKKGVQMVVTACAGCFKTLSEDWPRLTHKVLPFTVKHISEFLADHLDILKSKIKRFDVCLTYHDPCHLGRAMGVYDAPRRVLMAIPGVHLKEFHDIRENALCCGAGGGMRMNFPEISQKLALRRIRQAKILNVSILSTSCVFCKYNFQKAIHDTADDSIQILNLEDIIAQLLISE